MKMAPRLRSLDGAVICFLSNKKRNNEPLVHALADAMRRRHELGGAQHWRKSSPYRPVSGKMAKEILAECQALVVGPGD